MTLERINKKSKYINRALQRFREKLTGVWSRASAQLVPGVIYLLRRGPRQAHDFYSRTKKSKQGIVVQLLSYTQVGEEGGIASEYQSLVSVQFVCVSMCGGQRSMLGVIPWVLVTLSFETGSFSGLKLTK